jgi:transmembrane sensor
MTRRINTIDRQAAEWVAITDGTEPPAETLRALNDWLAEDPRHLGAYLKAKVVLAHIEKHGKVLPSKDVVWLDGFREHRRRFIAGTLAACLAAFAIVLGLGWRQSQPVTYATRLGEHRTVTLADGSSMTMNTSSKVVVLYSGAKRRLTLEEGEVLFDVAKNMQRPFIVSTRGLTVQAVGTSFAVRTLPNTPVQVLVAEGVVRVADRSTVLIPSLRANTRAVIATGSRPAIETITPQEVSQGLAWRDGQVFFLHKTLASAAQEFARYHRTTIVITDPSIAQLTVTGSYVASDPVGFAKAVALSFDLNAVVGNNEVRLTRRKS